MDIGCQKIHVHTGCVKLNILPTSTLTRKVLEIEKYIGCEKFDIYVGCEKLDV